MKKLNVVIVKDASSDNFTGFIRQYSAVSSQANTIDQLMDNLKRNLGLYFDYLKASELSTSDDILTLGA